MNRLGQIPQPPSPPRAFGRAFSTDERKRLVLDAAAQLFEHKGFHGTSMQDIATAVGVTKAAVYHYVDSKDQLLYEIHDAFVSTMLENLEAVSQSDIGPKEQLRFIVNDIFRAITEYRPYVRAFFQDFRSLDGEWFELIDEKRGHYERIVTQCLEQGVKEGVFEIPASPNEAALFFFGACNWAYQWLDPSGPRSTEELADEWFQMLIKAFAPKRAARGKRKDTTTTAS